MTITWESPVNEIVWESQTAPGITWTTVVGGTGGTEIPARRLLPNTVGTPGQTVVVNDEGTAVEYVDAPSGGSSFPTNTNPTTDPPEPVDGASWRPSDSPSLLALAADNKWRGGWLADDGTDQTAETVDPDAITWVSTTAPGTFRFGAGGITVGSLGFWLLEADPRTGSGHPGAVGSVVWSSTVGSWLRKTGVGAMAWEVVGDVVGPASSTDGRPALFDGTTGKLLKVGGVNTPDGLLRLNEFGVAPPTTLPSDLVRTSELTTAVDAKVADAINDGTTTVAPSQNAVFDALALKVPTSRTLAGLDLSANRSDSDLRTALGLVIGTNVPQFVANHGFRLSGNSVRDYCIPGEAILTNSATATPTQNRCVFERWRLRTAQTFDRVAMEVTATGGSGKVIRMSVWSTDQYGQPAALVVDFGTIDANSATLQALTISLTLPPGDYLGVWVTDGTPTVRTVSVQPLGFNAISAVAGSSPVRNQASFAGSGVAAGGFPSTPGSTVTIERDIYTATPLGSYAMRLREA